MSQSQQRFVACLNSSRYHSEQFNWLNIFGHFGHLNEANFSEDQLIAIISTQQQLLKQYLNAKENSQAIYFHSFCQFERLALYCPQTLQQQLQAVFRCPFNVTECSPKRFSNQTFLNSTALNRTRIGDFFYEASYHFLITIGPIEYQQYLMIIADDHKLQSIHDVLIKNCPLHLSYSIEVQIKKDSFQACRLNGSPSNQLGITSWLDSKTDDYEDRVSVSDKSRCFISGNNNVSNAPNKVVKAR